MILMLEFLIELTNDAKIAWWDQDKIIYEGESYELLTSGNAEKAENLGGSVVINYRPMPLISMMLTHMVVEFQYHGRTI